MKLRKKPIISLSDFAYNLPAELIGQKPIKPRDQARLLVLNRQSGRITHSHFFNLPEFLRPGDVLIFNDSAVIPARLRGRKESGGKIEIFLLRQQADRLWQILIGGKLKTAKKVFFAKDISCRILGKFDEQSWLARFNCSDNKLFSIGQTPLPHYIKGRAKLADYQTVYARQKGSVAAPTAGLHFTKRLLRRLAKQGIQIEYVTLHVGLGTFAPVKAENIVEHKLHAEWGELDAATAERINRAKKQGQRIIAVGTTSVRILEAFADKRGKLKPQKRWIDIFIYPGYRFRLVNALITNFHLPQSTLLMLVSALAQCPADKAAAAGRKKIFRAYWEAIRKKYKFYSFGEGMLIN